jgi:hypothetical protein
MQRGDAVLVRPVGIEAAGEHGFEHRGIAAFRGALQHEVMLGPELPAQVRVRGQHRLGGRAVTAGAGGDEPLQRATGQCGGRKDRQRGAVTNGRGSGGRSRLLSAVR